MNDSAAGSARSLKTNYVLHERLGAGGQSEVWHARDPQRNADIALKILKPAPGRADAAWEALVYEYECASRLEHPNILRVYPPERVEGTFLLPMELGPGGDLRRLRGGGYLDIVPVLLEVAQALEHAHERGVIHRDLKPGNVLFDERGRAKLADFGVSGVAPDPGTDAMIRGLSPFTASPEQLRGEPPSPADDIYGLGALAYELLSRYPPHYPHFDARRVQQEPVPPLEPTQLAPPQLTQLIERMLAKDARQRPSSMREVIEELESSLHDTLTFDFETEAAEEAGSARRASPAEVLSRTTPAAEPRTPAPAPAMREPPAAPATPVRRQAPPPAPPPREMPAAAPPAYGQDRPRPPPSPEAPLTAQPPAAEPPQPPRPWRETPAAAPPVYVQDRRRTLPSAPPAAPPTAQPPAAEPPPPQPPPPPPPPAAAFSEADPGALDGQRLWEELRDAPIEVSEFEPRRSGGPRMLLTLSALALAALAAFVILRFFVGATPPAPALPPTAAHAKPDLDAEYAAARAAFEQRYAALEARGAAGWDEPDLAGARQAAAAAADARSAGNLPLAGQHLAYASQRLDAIERAAPGESAAAASPPAAAPAPGAPATAATTPAPSTTQPAAAPTPGPQQVGDDYARAAGEGFAALGAGRLDEARRAFERARALRPEGAEAAEGLKRVAAASAKRSRGSLRSQAAQYEAEERWPEAAAAYNKLLQQDGSLGFAQAGKTRAVARAQLDDSLRALIEHPEPLSTADGRDRAARLLREAENAPPPRSVLRAEIAQLTSLVPALDKPVHLEIVSDSYTQVSIPNVGAFGSFARRDIELKPGRYTLVGTRSGYRDVHRDIVLSAGQQGQTITVSCDQAVGT